MSRFARFVGQASFDSLAATRRSAARLASVAVVVAAAAGPALAAQIPSNWLGGPGNWSEAAKWSGGVPNNGANTFNVFIDNGNASVSDVHLNQNATIDNLSVSSGDSLYIDNNRRLMVSGTAGAGSINNAGTIYLNSTGGNTYLQPTGGPLTLSGSGTLQLSDSAANWVYHSGGGSLVNSAGHTVRGAGNFGYSGASMPITNNGLVISDFAANALEVTPGNLTFTNTGTLRAHNGSTMRVHGSGIFENAGGVIEALTGSIVNIDGATIRGGTLQTTGSGAIRTISNAALDGTANTINNAGALNVVNNNRCYAVGTINNTGTISMESTGGNTYLHPNVGQLTLAGNGTLQMSDSPANWIYHSGGGSLVNTANHTIRGAGNLGYSGAPTPITNDGLVISEFVTNALIVNPGTLTFTNNGTLRAQSGSVMRLQGGGVFENTSGVIEALNGSTVSIENITIRGGTLQTAGSGILNASASALLDGTINPIAIDGLLRVANSNRLYAVGTLNNTGVIELSSAGSHTYLQPEGGALTLSGGGSLNLSDNDFNWIHRGAVGGSLVNVDNTIQGAGNVGYSGAPTPITNHSLIVANLPAHALQVDSGGVVTNDGTLRADNGGTLRLQGTGGFSNAGGTIEARNNSVVSLENTTIRGGTLQTAGTGAVYITANSVLNGSTNSVNNTGFLRIQNNHRGYAVGTINNSGVMEIGSTGAFTYLQPDGGALTFTGGGTLRLSDNANNYVYQNGGGSLVNSAGHTIRGAGRLGYTAGPTPITNQGTIIADGVNTLSLEGVPFTTSGTVAVNAGSTLSRPNGDFTQTAGSTTVNGTLSASGFVDIQGGSLAGSGTVSKVKNGGTVRPGTSVGTLTVNGTYVQNTGAALNIEIAGPAANQADKLVVTGIATLGGALNVDEISGYVPQISDSWTILTASAVHDVFNNLSGTQIAANRAYRVKYTTDDVRIQVSTICGTHFACDTNCDGSVNQFDIPGFIDVLQGAAPCSSCAADVTGDGSVNLFDITGFVECVGL